MSELKLVRDLMTVGVPTCPVDAAVIDLAKMMIEKDWEAVVVLDGEQGHAVGVVSRKELAQAYVQGEFAGLTAEDVMGERIPSVPPDIPIAVAAQIMLDEGVRAAYITHHAGGIKYPAAWLPLKNLIRHMIGDDLSDLGIRAAREQPLDTFIRRRDEARKRALHKGER
jgi:CBS domain-containing protein